MTRNTVVRPPIFSIRPCAACNCSFVLIGTSSLRAIFLQSAGFWYSEASDYSMMDTNYTINDFCVCVWSFFLFCVVFVALFGWFRRSYTSSWDTLQSLSLAPIKAFSLTFRYWCPLVLFEYYVTTHDLWVTCLLYSFSIFAMFFGTVVLIGSSLDSYLSQSDYYTERTSRLTAHNINRRSGPPSTPSERIASIKARLEKVRITIADLIDKIQVLTDVSNQPLSKGDYKRLKGLENKLRRYNEKSHKYTSDLGEFTNQAGSYDHPIVSTIHSFVEVIAPMWKQQMGHSWKFRSVGHSVVATVKLYGYIRNYMRCRTVGDYLDATASVLAGEFPDLLADNIDHILFVLVDELSPRTDLDSSDTEYEVQSGGNYRNQAICGVPTPSFETIQVWWGNAAHSRARSVIMKIIGLLVCFGLLGTDGEYKKMVFEILPKIPDNMDCGDIVQSVWEIGKWVVSKAGVLVSTRDITTLWTDISGSEKNIIEHVTLTREAVLFTQGNVDEMAIDPSSLKSRLDKLKDSYVRALKLAKPIERAAIHRTLLSVNAMCADVDHILDSAALVPRAYGMLIHSPPGVGKSSLLNSLWIVMARANGKPCEQTDSYVLNLTEQYQSGYRKQSCVIMDDMAQVVPQLAKTSSNGLVVQMINNTPVAANMADVESKGVLTFTPDFVIGTTNNLTLNANLEVYDSGAVYRRFNVLVQPKVRPEYARPGQHTLNSESVQGARDLWTMTLSEWHFRTTNGNVASDGYWKVLVGPDGRPMEDVGLDEAHEFLIEHSKAHFKGQKQLIASTAKLMSTTVCEHGRFPDICRLCKHCPMPLATIQEDGNKHFNIASPPPHRVSTRSIPAWGKFRALFDDFRPRPDDLPTMSNQAIPTTSTPSSWFWYFGYKMTHGPISSRFYATYLSFILWVIPALYITISPAILSVGVLICAKLLLSIGLTILGAGYWFVGRFRAMGYWDYLQFVKVITRLPIARRVAKRWLKVSASILILCAAYRYFQPDAPSLSNQGAMLSAPYNSADVKLGSHLTHHSVYENDVRTITYDQLLAKVANVLGFLDFYKEDENGRVGVRCNALPLLGTYWLVPYHTVCKNYTNATVIRGGAQLSCSRSPGSSITTDSWVRVGDTDLAVICLPRACTQTNMLKHFSSVLLKDDVRVCVSYRNEDGVVRQDATTVTKAGHPYTNECGVSYKSVHYTLPYDTFSGLCGSPLVIQQKHPTIVGVHSSGVSGTPKALGHLVTRGQLEDAIKSLGESSSLGMTNQCLDTFSYPIDVSPVVHPKTPTNWFTDAGLYLWGNTTSPRRAYSSSVVTTPIAPSVEKYFGFPNRWKGAPMKGWAPWSAFVDGIGHNWKVQFEPSLLQKAAFDYRSTIFGGLSQEDIDSVAVLSDEQSILGTPGVIGEERINFSTGMGLSVFGSGRKDKVFKRIYDDMGHLTPDVEPPPGFFDEVHARAAKLASGLRLPMVFQNSLKDEVVKSTKTKTRIISCASVEDLVLTRKYFLPLARLVRTNNYLFECAVGLNVYGRGWHRLISWLFAISRLLICGDYRAYDQNMPPEVILLVFDILIDIGKRAGYSPEDIAVMRGIAAEVAYPVYDVDGTIVMSSGSNPSGHALTIIINSMANSLYLRYVYYSVAARYGISPAIFSTVVHLMTMGDDNIMSVDPSISTWFNGPAIAAAFAACGIDYTRADKTPYDDSAPFDTVATSSFLKRRFVYSDDLGVYTCPIELDSIYKSLYMHIPSKVVEVRAQLASTITNAVIEAFHHGEQFYNDFVQRMLLVCAATDIDSWIDSGVLSSYADKLQAWRTTNAA